MLPLTSEQQYKANTMTALKSFQMGSKQLQPTEKTHFFLVSGLHFRSPQTT